MVGTETSATRGSARRTGDGAACLRRVPDDEAMARGAPANDIHLTVHRSKRACRARRWVSLAGVAVRAQPRAGYLSSSPYLLSL